MARSVHKWVFPARFRAGVKDCQDRRGHPDPALRLCTQPEHAPTVQARAQRDPAFRKALLQEGVECLLADDIETGKAVLRDYINATIGFEELSRVFDKSSKSLMRMFGPKGNPRQVICLR